MIFPVEVCPCSAEVVVSVGGGFYTSRDVGCVSGDFRGDDADANVVDIWQAEMLFRGDVAEEGGAVESGGGSTDSGCYVVVAGCDVCDEWAEYVKWGVVTEFLLDFHVVFNLVEWYVAGAFDDDLAVFLLGPFCEFGDGFQFGELGVVGGVGDAAWAEAITERKADVVLGHYVAEVVEHFVEGVLFIVVEHPFCEQSASAADDSGEAIFEQREVFF